jgi:hypothetical protein
MLCYDNAILLLTLPHLSISKQINYNINDDNNTPVPETIPSHVTS